ncbi:hypothetical protein HPP92_017885 [Vanilla planifolia]|uniref:Uncharacterized protein n=1 Tax=Vanilla planifolia TaxID=51239 RepID=A0A835Q8Q4_VANPL|nr:hypothetical protein HPP92_017885 [Vanilla planifolia]
MGSALFHMMHSTFFALLLLQVVANTTAQMQPWVQGGGELPDTSPTQMKAQGGNPAAAEQFTVEKHEVPTGPNPDANK